MPSRKNMSRSRDGKGPKQGTWADKPRPGTAARESKLCYGRSWEPHAVLEQGSDRWKLIAATLGRRPLPTANPTCWLLLGCLARHWVARFSEQK